MYYTYLASIPQTFPMSRALFSWPSSIITTPQFSVDEPARN